MTDQPWCFRIESSGLCGQPSLGSPLILFSVRSLARSVMCTCDTQHFPSPCSLRVFMVSMCLLSLSLSGCFLSLGIFSSACSLKVGVLRTSFFISLFILSYPLSIIYLSPLHIHFCQSTIYSLPESSHLSHIFCYVYRWLYSSRLPYLAAYITAPLDFSAEIFLTL